MKSAITLLVSIMILNVGILFGQQKTIRLIDPQGMSRTDKATMDSLTVILKPEGAYTQVSFMINISTRGTRFNSNKDTVEIESYFQLPENAIVNDSWLWVEDTLVFADLIDRWSASKIYEDIVRRFRRDPSIFFKNSTVDYEFRLFPLAGNNHRKFLISMMIPNSIDGNKFVVTIPDLWFGLVNQPQNVNVIFLYDKNYSNIKYLNGNQVEFSDNSDIFFGEHMKAEIKTAEFMTNRSFIFEAPIKDGVHLSKYNNGSDKYFQLALNTNILIPGKKSTRHLFVFEYVSGIAFQNIALTVNTLISKINEIYSSGDFVNIMYVNKIGQIKNLSQEWIEMDNEGKSKLTSLSNELVSNSADFPFLPLLIENALEQFKNNLDSLSDIVIFASSGSFGDLNTANTLLNKTLQENRYNRKFYILDHSNVNALKNNNINNINYKGNEYLYQNLSRLTKGEYLNLWSFKYSWPNFFDTFKNLIFSYPNNLDYFITTNDGFAYHYFEVANKGGTMTLVGKYVGGDDFSLRFTYMLDNEPKYREFVITSKDIINNNKSPQIWIGNHLKYLESQPNPNNKLISDIINLSMGNRVLSRYTAFLALEPWMRDSLFSDNDNQDNTGGGATDVDELVDMDKNINAFPNPASEFTTINIFTPVPIRISSIQIYDMSGRIIRNISVPEILISGEYNLNWDLTDDYGNPVANGSYYIIVSIGIKSLNTKVIINR